MKPKQYQWCRLWRTITGSRLFI